MRALYARTALCMGGKNGAYKERTHPTNCNLRRRAGNHDVARLGHAADRRLAAGERAVAAERVRRETGVKADDVCGELHAVIAALVIAAVALLINHNRDYAWSSGSAAHDD